MPVLRLLQANGRLTYFVTSMVFGGIANALAFLILGRMRTLGLRVGLWRTHRDWVPYRQYWRIAPEQNWSRAPIVVGLLSLVPAAYFLWLAVR
jgi:hypothetical protein